GAVTGPAAATLPDAPTFDLFPAALHPMAHASATIAKDIRKPPNICAPLGAPLSPSFSPPLFDSAASLRVLLGDFTLSLFAKNHVRHANPKKIKREHGRHEHQHRGCIRRGRNDRSHDGDDQNGVSQILPEPLRRDNAKNRKHENQYGKLEDCAEPNHHYENQVEILADADERLERTLRSLESDEELQDERQQNEIRETDAAEKEKNGRENEGKHGLAFVLIEAGRDEKPDLMKDHGQRDYQTQIEAHFDQKIHVLGGTSKNQLVGIMRLLERMHHRLRDEVDDPFCDGKPDDKSDGDGERGIKQALAQFDQMFNQRHFVAGVFFGSAIGLRQRGLARRGHRSPSQRRPRGLLERKQGWRRQTPARRARRFARSPAAQERAFR